MKTIALIKDGVVQRQSTLYLHHEVRDSNGRIPQLPDDGDQLELSIGDKTTSTVLLMYSEKLGGWVSSHFHPDYLKKGLKVKIVDETNDQRVA